MNKEDIIQSDEAYFMNVFGGRLPIVVDKGEGIKVWDEEGNEYLDFLAGIAVNALGHSHPKVNQALKEQIDKVIHCTNIYYIEPQAKLNKLLVENSAGDRIFYGNSGAEANEGAIKLARKYFKVRDEERYEVITTTKSFHGRTLATIAATGQEKYQKPFTPLPEGFKEVPFNDLAALKEAVSDKTCAIMVEPIQGEGGINVADQEYLQGVRKLCDEEGILLILDEIQTGLGRTGKFFGYEHYGIEPDIFTLAKALGNGVPVSAFLAKEEVADAFEPGDHGSTFGGNPLACIAAYTTVKTILEEDIVQHTVEIGEYFEEKLSELIKKYDFVNSVRGKGLMLGLEVDLDAKKLVHEALEKGLLINAVSETTLRFLPPLIVEKGDIDNVIDILDRIFAKYL
ncbi:MULTISPECIES: aspartate aminotransferase family protein [unclassified Candidatus Frackibacter]|uniref:aspartate aminotransferase family protein n=1 Tax=unclassified Candidatus Frackibacter TaxID=2648818 RepID=UPI00079C8E97|nr:MULTISPECIES: aspartate aminotransferase family protein [unclassified Candidatus Frackibacter]KXS41686.1 MAG: acetylornithine aminotransferase [Candidatus Frackibacter sp. T328-2]SDB97597.1 acetylornithine aminotransferase apoenzyme [Candidatus Frackibacter sp. WG11]SEM29296.1 acetylornithine aminotransferase apoenzyme [Candidatus Frackibacter sp. WG12]SFL34173.1 acetylornithine aminotransferase apoenzyme [Candidatus Frackibacter sp. WG13]